MQFYPGVETREDLAKLYNTLGYKVGAEIGVASGKFSRIICLCVPGVKLNCIDIWQPDAEDPWDYSYPHDYQYAKATKLLKHFDAKLIKGRSMEVVKTFSDDSLDFVYIDANHKYEFVLEDITEWEKKVRPGGIVSGHDFYRLKGFGVRRAVFEYVAAHNIIDWYITVEKPHSFFWIKP